jgi:choline-sulfatase
MSQKNPNILFVMFDQMTAKALPCYGHPVVKAPNISSLAEGGVIFENAYCNSPLCAPSRSSMMSGQLASRIGTYDNSALFPEDVPTIAHYLRDNGYYTCLSGKMHFIGADQQHGFEDRLTTDIYPADYGWTPDWENFKRRPTWYHNMLSVVQSGLCVTSNQIDFDEDVAFNSIQKINELARSDDDRPFFLLTSFTHPHDPFAITKEYWDLYEDEEIDMPALPALPYEELDPHSKRLYHVSAMGEYEQTKDRVRSARHAYFSEISYVDDKVGELVAALEKTGLKDDTIIVVTSDHGEMLGERGMWYKMSYFEWASRVPMIIYAPGYFSSRRVKQPVSLVDLLPTLTEMTSGSSVPQYADVIDGKSLLPLLKGQDEDSLAAVYGEILCEGAISPIMMIRRDRYKYIYCDADPEQLYNLENDPDETNNLARNPEYETLRNDFYAEVISKWDTTALRQKVVASQHRRRLVDRSMRKGKFISWDFQPFEDASLKYMRSHLDLNILERKSRFPSPDIPEPDGKLGKRVEG